MAKGKFSKDNDDNNVGRDTVNFEQSKEEKYMQTKSDVVTLVFKQNRKKELHIGRDVYTFWGASSLEVPRSVIEHPDFESQRKYFLVKGE